MLPLQRCAPTFLSLTRRHTAMVHLILCHKMRVRFKFQPNRTTSKPWTKAILHISRSSWTYRREIPTHASAPQMNECSRSQSTEIVVLGAHHFRINRWAVYSRVSSAAVPSVRATRSGLKRVCYTDISGALSSVQVSSVQCPCKRTNTVKTSHASPSST